MIPSQGTHVNVRPDLQVKFALFLHNLPLLQKQNELQEYLARPILMIAPLLLVIMESVSMERTLLHVPAIPDIRDTCANLKSTSANQILVSLEEFVKILLMDISAYAKREHLDQIVK